jgi:cyclopropane fatty-acyl-phospholipid synthase-like methyltransferase
MTTASYDQIADRFHGLRTTLQPKEVEYLSLLLDHLPQGSEILDLGCGTGRPIAEHIAACGHHVVGVDGSAAMLAFARAQLPAHRWIHDRIEQVEFDKTFDAVVCWDSLFHLPRRYYEPVIQRIHGWLAPGGRMMVSSGGCVDEHPEGFTDTMFGHEFYYDSPPPEQVVAMIEGAGFVVLRAEMCDPPDAGRNKGKWATVAERGGAE